MCRSLVLIREEKNHGLICRLFLHRWRAGKPAPLHLQSWSQQVKNESDFLSSHPSKPSPISSAAVSNFPSDFKPFQFSRVCCLIIFRLSSTVSGSDSLFGPPLESAFKSKSFDGREQLRDHSFAASECKSDFFFQACVAGFINAPYSFLFFLTLYVMWLFFCIRCCLLIWLFLSWEHRRLRFGLAF